MLEIIYIAFLMFKFEAVLRNIEIFLKILAGSEKDLAKESHPKQSEKSDLDS